MNSVSLEPARLERHRHFDPLTVVIAVGAALLAFASYPLGAGTGAAIAGFGAAVLVILASVDIRRGIIPNRIVLPATAIVLLAQVMLFPSRGVEIVTAAAVAGVCLLIPRLINGSWMGMGDVKLGLLLGVVLGWGAIGAIALAFLAVFPAAVFVLIRSGVGARKATLPFGPFLALGALAILIVAPLAGLGAS